MQLENESSNAKKDAGGSHKASYIIILLVILIVAFFAIYFLYPRDQSSSNGHAIPKAVLVDHLSFLDQENETFTQNALSILTEAGFSVTYYEGQNVTVDFYRTLSEHGYNLIILRVHSSAIKNTTWIGLFTSEVCPNLGSPKYLEELESNKLALARHFSDNKTWYYAITPLFVSSSMKGNFENAAIIMMGCDGMKYNSMAKAFCDKGAKVYVSWTGAIPISHTDHATIVLLQQLLRQNRTIEDAVKDISPWEGSKLEYYPRAVGDRLIQDLVGEILQNFPKFPQLLSKFEIKSMFPDRSRRIRVTKLSEQ
jgi:flagellar basal body-associated protein FliL